MKRRPGIPPSIRVAHRKFRRKHGLRGKKYVPRRSFCWWLCTIAFSLLCFYAAFVSKRRLKRYHLAEPSGKDVQTSRSKNQPIVGNASESKSTDAMSRASPLMNSKPAANDERAITGTEMKSILQERFNNLPPPPWPQLDLRIPKAIMDGELVGFDNDSANNQLKLPLNASTSSNIHTSNTIVTSYYEFTSKHAVWKYRKWFKYILQTSDPMIVFLEPGSPWIDFVKKKRMHAPTILALIPFDELVMSTTFSEEFWDFMRSIDTESKVHKGTGVYKIWNEKMVFMHASITLNPFNTAGFAWMDAGYFRKLDDAPQLYEPIVKVNITKEGVPEEKLLLLHIRDDEVDAVARVNIAGNSFVGTGRAFLEFYPLYFQTFWDWVSKKKFVGSDQFVITEACRRYRSHCHPFFPGRFKHWFAMSKALAGKINFSEVSPKYLFADPPATIPEMPSGKKVTYCNGEMVTRNKGVVASC